MRGECGVADSKADLIDYVRERCMVKACAGIQPVQERRVWAWIEHYTDADIADAIGSAYSLAGAMKKIEAVMRRDERLRVEIEHHKKSML
jgi:hypothetical protein